jgi:NAD(P)-dependent dehydrogenase (short-subunit alcohol dehydrogenase family)
MEKWTARHIPSLSGQNVVVTGGTPGLGFETARQHAKRGARVIIASNDGNEGPKTARKLNVKPVKGELNSSFLIHLILNPSESSLLI